MLSQSCLKSQTLNCVLVVMLLGQDSSSAAAIAAAAAAAATVAICDDEAEGPRAEADVTAAVAGGFR
jgi:hypothetical protein